MKRSFDILLSFIGLLLGSPLFAIILIVIFLSDFKVPFYFQNRVGHHGKLFKLIKFRSMSVNKSAEDGTFDLGNKNRVTRVGRILRRTKIDELPQLINVLKGEMSFVGPRPEVEKWVKIYPEKWAYVQQVRPGLTNYASIEFLNEEEILAQSRNPEETYRNYILPRKLELDEQYVREQSFFMDVIIIFRTICAIILRQTSKFKITNYHEKTIT